jgi:hypothetical protein
LKLFFGILLCVVFFFVIGGPSSFSGLIFHALWNLGHPLIFAAITFYILKYHLQSCSHSKRAFIVLIFVIIISLIIELVQEKLNRTFDWLDIFNNTLGSCLLLIWFFLKNRKQSPLLHTAIVMIMVLLQGFILIPLYQALKTQYNNHHSFPTLSLFNDEIELKKWKGDNILLIKKRNEFSEYALKVNMLAHKKYNPVTLKHFSSNWYGFEKLVIHIELESKQPIDFCVRITDIQHDYGEQKYEDRFQKCFKLSNNPNTINIPLADIIQAPLNRQLDIKHISEVTLYSHNLVEDLVVYINKIELM